MKLSLRINYILLPVILAIFSTAGFYAYINQKELIVNAVSEKLKYTGQYAIQDVHKNIEELLGLTEIFLNSSELIQYLNSDLSDETSLASESHLIRYLDKFHLSYGEFKRISLLDENNSFIFHYDNTDPFSKPNTDADVIAHQKAIFSQLKTTGSTYFNPVSYLLRKETNGQIKLIIFRTFSPQHLIADNTFSGSMKFVTAIAETTLDVSGRYLEPMQISFDKGLQLSVDPVARVMTLSNELELNQVREEALNLFSRSKSKLASMQLSLPPAYLDNLLIPYREAIISLIFSISMVTFLVLKVLIQKQIISPVIKLTKTVQRARDGDETKLTKIDKKDEIAQLNNNYVLLFNDLNKMAKLDSLTGLSNRALFNTSLKRVVSHSVRTRSHSALLYIDLDNFKYVNDHYGHHIGDRLLKAFSDKLISIFEQEDITGLEKSDYEVARLAGDEFAVLVSDIQNNDVVAQVAKKITDICSRGFEVNDQHFDIRVSIGITICPEDSSDAEELLKHADFAMYQVKNSGKNGYQFYSKKLDSKIHRHAMIEAELKKALYEKSFYLVWMPVYDCRSGKVTGAEALLRTDSKGLTDIGPAEFIPIAETTGLIKDIDYWVIESAIIKLKELIEQHNFSGVIAVNFSAWELKNHQFSHDVGALIQKYKVPANQLELEITETCLVADDTNAKKVLKQLKDLGVQLALDDFGTGYTAFNQLADYPVDILKIDRTFINSIFDRERANNKPLIDIIVELASLYSLEVIAEGIETKEQLSYATRLGCDRAQGFYMSKPVPWTAFLQLIEKRDISLLDVDDYANEHQFEFRSVTGSVKVITADQMITLLYKGVVNNELLDFVLKSMPSCIAHLKETVWGIITVSDDEYELSAATQKRLGELLKYCFDNGCVDGAYMVTKPEAIKQIIALRQKFGLKDDFNSKNFSEFSEAQNYIKQKIAEAET